jgi:hypothetical protein
MLIPIISLGLVQACSSVIGPDPLGLQCLLFSLPWIPFWFFFPRLPSVSEFLYWLTVIAAWCILGLIIGVVVTRSKTNAHL